VRTAGRSAGTGSVVDKEQGHEEQPFSCSRPGFTDADLPDGNGRCRGADRGAGGSYKWLKNGGNGDRYPDARMLFFYQATVNTPVMVEKMVGRSANWILTVPGTGWFLILETLRSPGCPVR